MECTCPRGDLEVGQLEKVVRLPVCTRRRASFFIFDAMARICTLENSHLSPPVTRGFLSGSTCTVYTAMAGQTSSWNLRVQSAHNPDQDPVHFDAKPHAPRLAVWFEHSTSFIDIAMADIRYNSRLTS